MDRFKDSIQMEDNIEVSENDSFNLDVDHDLNDETIEEISSDHEIPISGIVSKIETQDSPIQNFSDFIQIEDDVEMSENEYAAEISHDSNYETIKEISNVFVRENEKQEDFDLQLIE